MTVSEEVELFVEDAIERLDEADRAALAIDEALQAGKEPDGQALNALFRAVHTLKGNAGIVGSEESVTIAHALEWGLERLRTGAIGLSREVVNHTFAGLDALRTIVTALVQPGDEPLDVVGVARAIEKSFDGRPATQASSLEARFPGWLYPATPQRLDAEQRLGTSHNALFRLVWPAEAPFDPMTAPGLDLLVALGTFAAWRPLEPGQWELAYVTPADEDTLLRFLPDELLALDPWSEPQPTGLVALPAPAAVAAPEPTAAAEPSAAADPHESSIRVGINLLDKLMNLVGELVLTRNQVLQQLRGQDDASLQAPVQRLNLITTELQEAVMRTRMQPVGQVWERFPRMIRDYCQSSGKLVQLVVEGAETELDKSLLEGIKDPLTHLVRNAIDHGIELPDARLAEGKEARATLGLLAYQDGGQIIMEVRDDGRGLDYERIRAKALARGVAGADQLARMNEAELAQLIFQPGFSTAETVTSISGRGVGMDVVRNNIERIGGTVELQSTPGKGTTMRLRIPLTLAVIPALIIHAGKERFALPQSAVLEVVRTGEGLQRVERIHDAYIYRLRDSLIPVVPLRTVLGLGQTEDGLSQAQLVVIQSGAQVLGLAVDEIGDTEEIVVKPLHRFLQALSVYSGVTIMGDGRSCMILDVAGLAGHGGLAAHPRAAKASAELLPATAAEQGQRLLLCRLDTRTFALPMGQVARLEEFAAGRIERLGDRLATRYGQGLLPVVTPEPLLDLPLLDAGAAASVVVVGEGDQAVGVRVHEIVDIVHDAGRPYPVAGVPGVAGAVLLAGATIELLDLATVVDQGHACYLPDDERLALLSRLAA